MCPCYAWSGVGKALAVKMDLCLCVRMFFLVLCAVGLWVFINLIFHALWQSSDCSYLMSSCVMVSVPCSTLTVAELAVGRGVDTAGKGVDVGITGVMQGLVNPGSVLTIQKKNKAQTVEC